LETKPDMNYSYSSDYCPCTHQVRGHPY